MKFKKLYFLLILILITSCAQLKSVSQTSIPKSKGKVVEATVKKNIFLFFSFSTDFVNNLVSSLQSQCPKGSVKGILTKNYTVTYVPIIFHQEIISAQGFCHVEK